MNTIPVTTRSYICLLQPTGIKVYTDHNGKYTQTIRPIGTHKPSGSQIGSLENNERTDSDCTGSRMTCYNACTYGCTFSNVFSCCASPSVKNSQVIIILCYRFRSRSRNVILILKNMVGRGSNREGEGL